MRPEAALLLLVAGLAPALAQPAPAAPTLAGRTVELRIALWDDPAKPLIDVEPYRAEVGPGPEFVISEEWQGGFRVIPGEVDLKPTGFTVTIEPNEAGTYSAAKFNGFIVTFPADCTVVEAASLDLAATSPRLRRARVIAQPTAVLIDVAALPYASGDRLAVRITPGDCPVS